MPHQCVRCGTMYDDGAEEILKGCSCGAKLFFFVKKKDVEKKKEKLNLSDTDKKRIEKDVYDIMGSKIDKDKPIVLDLESINVVKPGKYELDLVNLFKKSPLVYKLEEGKYVVDLLQKFDEDSKKE
ncbi:MAG: Zn-ribbon domain-containing protein [Nanobdellota archaeon]